MSNRFEDRFNKLKKVANQDPILLSGLDISILTVVEHRDDRLKLVESLIRKHWEHVHPDKASSAEDRQNREKNRKELEQALRRPGWRGGAVGPPARRLFADFEVFHHGQVGEHTAVLGHKAQAQASRTIRLTA